jgi:cobalt-zinc-cadmium efflux system outer membrane protein
LTLRFDQEIELAGRRGLRMHAAEASVDGARARFENARRLLALDVQRAYFQAVLAKADRDVAQASLSEIDRAITLNSARFEQGEISGGELRRLQVERLRFVDDVFAAELAFRNGRSALLALLNVADLGQIFDVTEPLAPPRGTVPVLMALGGPPQGPLPSTLAAEAMARRPDIVAAQREVFRAETETRLQRALRTPNVTIGAGYKRDFGTNAVVFGATVPLPLFNRNQGGLARAEAVQAQASNLNRAAENTVLLEVQQALNGLAINSERVTYIEREYLDTARESRDIVLASYRAGAADLIDFLDAQRAFRDTVRTYNRALYEQRISMFQLAAATALPPQQ